MTPKPPPAHHKLIFRHIVDALGESVKVLEMSATGTSVRQPFAVISSAPHRGVTSYSTIGLSDHGGYELVTASLVRNKSVIKALFDVVSSIVEGSRSATPGETFEKVIARYYRRCDAGHILLAATALPGLVIRPLKVRNRSVRWLGAWPLTSDELIALRADGYRRFAKRLADTGPVNVFDLDRGNLPNVPTFDPKH